MCERACGSRENPRCRRDGRSNEQIPRPDPAKIEAVLLRLVAERGPGKTVDPTEAARELGGTHPDQWGPLMQPIRRAAVALAEQGRLLITRKANRSTRATSRACTG